ncbi:MAG: PQQ-binding-like beta-propeller repeat protein [Pseudohongiellaceae bacterium]
MDISFGRGTWFLAFCGLGLIASQALAQSLSGEALFDANCATCHDNPTDRAPSRLALNDYNPNAIFRALDAGIMQSQAANLSADQKIIIAEYLTGGTYNRNRIERFTACATGIGDLDLTASSNWNGWGNDPGGQRYQSPAGTTINKSTINELELAWSFGVEGASAARAQPALIDGVMYIGSASGQVYALSLETGCHYWTYAAIAEVRAAPTVVRAAAIDKTLVIVADQSNRVYALDAQTGLKVWHADPDANPWAVSTGAPVVAGDRVFVPVSSMEVAAAGNPQHVCCTFRGNVAALDLNSGEKLWHTFIMEEATEVGRNSVGNPILAPSGAPIWGSASFDPKRNRVYVGSGQNYSRPTSDTSDSVIAFDASTGNMDWVFQSTANDAFTMGCTGRSEHPNCPDAGPDVDIGAPILSTTLSNGQDILIAGSKGAVVFGLDPDNDGAVLWQTRVGRGSPLGGVHWGMTFIGDTVFVPVSDRIPGGSAPAQPGLHAIDMKTGALLWYAQAPDRCESSGFTCSNAYSAAATAIEDLVIVGALNGVVFAHDKDSGEVVWELDTKVDYDTVNNVPASGGAIDATGPVISGDYMVLNSGYAQFGQLAGNAVIVYKLN